MSCLKWLTTISLFVAMPAQMVQASNYEYNVICEPDNCCLGPKHSEPISQPEYCQEPQPCTQASVCSPPSCSWSPDYGSVPCCEPCFATPCCPSTNKRSTIGYAIVGALILGAGAAAGYAAGHNEKNQSSKETCHQNHCCHPKEKHCCEKNNEICFLQDMHEELTFEICLVFDASKLGYNTCSCCCSSHEICVTSFVVDPLGKMETGKAQTINLSQNNGCYCYNCQNCTFEDQIHICNPFYGTYHFGLQIQFCNSLPADAFFITGKVKSSSTHTTTSVPIAVLSNFNNATFTQCTGEFSYAPEKHVPSK